MDRQSPTEATVAVGGGRGEGRLCGLGVDWGVGVSFIYVHERINNREMDNLCHQVMSRSSCHQQNFY